MKRIFGFFGAFFISSMAFAGGMEGGGGKGVVFKDAQGNVTSIELLDLWEARILFNRTIDPSMSSMSVAAGVDLILHRLKGSVVFADVGGCKDLNGGIATGQDCNLIFMQKLAALFLNPSPRVHRLRGATLSDTQDAWEIATPAKSAIAQIVDYQPGGLIFVDQDLYDKLDVVNQVALITHEAYYAMLREFANERDSQRTRRAVGFAMSGLSFANTIPEIPARHLECLSATEVGPPDYQLEIYPKPGPNREPGIAIIPVRFAGTSLIGLENGSFDNYNPNLNEDAFWPIIQGCDHTFPVIAGGSTYGYLGGPVEFDKYLSVGWSCHGHELSIRVDNHANSSHTPTIPLLCEFKH